MLPSVGGFPLGAAVTLTELDEDPHPDEAAIRRHMQPNLCRCGTHMRILRAVRRAAGLSVEGRQA